MCTCVSTHVRTRFVLTLGIKEKAPSPVLFSFVYPTPFLPSSDWFCLGCLKCAHHVPAIKSDVFITVTTKDIACPPTLPPAVCSPSAAVPRSCSASPRPPPLPFTHVPPVPVLHPEHLSCSRTKRSAAARPKIPGLAASPPTHASSRKGCLEISLLFLLSSRACQSHQKGGAG